MPKKVRSLLNTLQGPYLVTHLLTKSEATLDAPRYLVQCVQCGKSATYSKAALKKEPRCGHVPHEHRQLGNFVEVQAHQALNRFLRGINLASDCTVWVPLDQAPFDAVVEALASSNAQALASSNAQALASSNAQALASNNASAPNNAIPRTPTAAQDAPTGSESAPILTTLPIPREKPARAPINLDWSKAK